VTSKEIALATNIGKSTVHRLLHLYKETGSVVKRPDIMGRPRMLNSFDVAVGSM
jgi:transposase